MDLSLSLSLSLSDSVGQRPDSTFYTVWSWSTLSLQRSLSRLHFNMHLNTDYFFAKSAKKSKVYSSSICFSIRYKYTLWLNVDSQENGILISTTLNPTTRVLDIWNIVEKGENAGNQHFLHFPPSVNHPQSMTDAVTWTTVYV